ncbi:MAG: rhodanese-related sulfurtransferase [Planctomycetota bacterium]|jgi:rhodanese-related sulfurtransferase
MNVRQKNLVTEVPTEEPAVALEHYKAKLAHETDCFDVHATEVLDQRGFVLVDVRSRALYEAGHLPGALHIPWSSLTEERLSGFAADTLFVVYCAGPHCNGSVRAAIRIAQLERPFKEMVGGVTGWATNAFI